MWSFLMEDIFSRVELNDKKSLHAQLKRKLSPFSSVSTLPTGATYTLETQVHPFKIISVAPCRQAVTWRPAIIMFEPERRVEAGFT